MDMAVGAPGARNAPMFENAAGSVHWLPEGGGATSYTHIVLMIEILHGVMYEDHSKCGSIVYIGSCRSYIINHRGTQLEPTQRRGASLRIDSYLGRQNHQLRQLFDPKTHPKRPLFGVPEPPISTVIWHQKTSQ